MSKYDEGSSKKYTSPSLSIDAAIASRCSSPPDSCPMSRSRKEPSSSEVVSSASFP